jgi:hypothetical protein
VEAAGLRGEGGQVVGRVEAAQRLLDQGVGPEEDDPGAVVRPHRGDGLADERLGRRGALAAHRVGGIDQEDHGQIIHRPHQLRPGQAQDEQGQDEQPQDQPHPAGTRPRPWPARRDPAGQTHQATSGSAASSSSAAGVVKLIGIIARFPTYPKSQIWVIFGINDLPAG